MAVGFIFGGENMPKTPQELAQMRAMAQALGRSNRTPQNLGEGIASIGDAILYRAMMSRADKAEKAHTDASANTFTDFANGLFSPSDTASVDTATAPAQPAIKSPQDAVDASPQKPLTGDMAEMEAYIREGAKKRSMDPDITVRAARSEGLAPGVWQSNVKKNGMREPSFGAFQMLFGDGKNFPRGLGNKFFDETGLDPRDPRNAKAMVDYALDTAKKDGWRQWYGPKKAGINRWDGINADQVASIDPALPSDTATTPAKTANQPVAVVPVPDGFEQPDPLANKNAKQVKVAQALSTASSNKANQAMTILNDPWATPGQRSVAQAYLKRFWDEQDATRARELQQADPLYQQNLRKGNLELDRLEHPPQARRMSDQEEIDAGLDPSGVYQVLPDGSYKTVREPTLKSRRLTADEVTAAGLDPAGVYEVDANDKVTTIQKPKERQTATVNGKIVDTDTGKVIFDAPEQIKPTGDMQEYDAYAADEVAAGRKPLSRLEYQQEVRKAGASQINNNMQGENAFDKKLAEKQAETFSSMADEGINARADLDVINQLDTFMKDKGGTLTGISALASGWGLDVKGADDITAAQALINKLVPTQRTPGSGTMSDGDVALFKASLPSLWNQPGGNEKIIGVMRGLAEYKQAQGEIADMVLSGDLSRQEARRKLREIPNPLASFRKQLGEKDGATTVDPKTVGTPKEGDVVDGYRFKGGNPADPTRWEKN